MILGQGRARGERAVFAEYLRFLDTYSDVHTPAILKEMKTAPRLMRERIGRPLSEWTDKDLLALFRGKNTSSIYHYNAFLAFLFFRGYRRANLNFLFKHRICYSLQHRPALVPFRQKLEQTWRELGYSKPLTGTILNLLIMLLVCVHKPVEELTRADFEDFRTEYQRRFQAARRRKGGAKDHTLSVLDNYLVHWGVLPRPRHIFRHEEYLARLRHPLIHRAIETFLQWMEIKFSPSTVDNRRKCLLSFFLWFQEEYPRRGRLDQVTRPVALAYARHLKQKLDNGQYGVSYTVDNYRALVLFYEFALLERLKSSPDRNPFSRWDMPMKPDPVSRYLADYEVRQLLQYCAQQATLKERTILITLLHTGLRSNELSAIKATDIVEIQSRWKLHVRKGKNRMDRLVPLTATCLETLRAWQETGWERSNDHLFTHHGRAWSHNIVCHMVHAVGVKLGIPKLTAHRFRHTFAVALLNYGMRESALQKVMGHLNIKSTLDYARIMDPTVEQSFADAVERMQAGPMPQVPSFFAFQDYSLFVENDAMSWIRLPHGYCRRNPQLYCETDVKCLLCDRYTASAEDLPRLKEMRERFEALGLPIKADVVMAQIRRLEEEMPPNQPRANASSGLVGNREMDCSC